MYSYHYLLDLPKTKSPATFLNITIVTGWFDSFLVTVRQILSEHWTMIRHANHAKKMNRRVGAKMKAPKSRLKSLFNFIDGNTILKRGLFHLKGRPSDLK